MRLSLTPAIFIASALAAPQAGGVGGLSTCAGTAAGPALLAAGCTASDLNCICNSDTLQTAAAAAISAAGCPAEDVEAAASLFTAQCANVISTTTIPPGWTPTGVVGDPVVTTPPGNETTTWSNGTICTKAPHCHDSNDTAPLPAPTQPEETCNGKCPTSGGDNRNGPAPTSTSGPQYTGAASKMMAGSAIFGLAGLAAVFAL